MLSPKHYNRSIRVSKHGIYKVWWEINHAPCVDLYDYIQFPAYTVLTLPLCAYEFVKETCGRYGMDYEEVDENEGT